jgi:hypothetical protein
MARIRRDAVIVLTACSVDYPPVNGGRCGPLQIETTPVPAQERPSQGPRPGP